MRIKHYYRFPKRITDRFEGNTLDMRNWDILRIDCSTPSFSIPENKKKYDEYCSRELQYSIRASYIIDLLIKSGLDIRNGSICSLGIGIGALEWNIKKQYPELYICCSDYTEQSIKKLSKLLDVDEFLPFDMSNDSFDELGRFDCLIMHRISTEFDFDAWMSIFEKAYKSNCKMICFVPTEFATSEDEERERAVHEDCIRKGEKDMFCGWMYSEDEFYNMFSEWYFIRRIQKIDNTGIIVLERK